MNQSNIQGGVRQITPEEIAQAQGRQLTPEELQKTQVLNLQAVEEVVKFEKRTSKKPALIVAIIGVLLLTLGTTFQIATTLKARKNARIEQRRIEERLAKQQKEEVKIPDLTCVETLLNNIDGTDTVLTNVYEFDEDGLIRFSKEFQIQQTVGNPAGAITVQNYITNYQPFINPIDGYQITVVPNATGLVVNVKVDFTKLDVTALNPIQLTHKSTSLDFAMGTSKEKVQSTLTSAGAICK